MVPQIPELVQSLFGERSSVSIRVLFIIIIIIDIRICRLQIPVIIPALGSVLSIQDLRTNPWDTGVEGGGGIRNGEKGSRKNFLQNDVKVFKLFLSTTSSEFVLLLANPNEPTHNPSIDGWELQPQLNCGAASIFRINELNDNSCV